MKINRALPMLVSFALLAGCETTVPPPPPPAPLPRPAPAPAPVQPPAAPAFTDWRDAPLTSGSWRYGGDASGSTARFSGPAGTVLATLRCDRAARTVSLLRAGSASSQVPASITTSSGIRQVAATPARENGDPALAIAFAAPDATLDAMAFSRGRFIVDVNGLPTLVLPAWAEVGRVIEDCR